jgi:hypothetical protein
MNKLQNTDSLAANARSMNRDENSSKSQTRIRERKISFHVRGHACYALNQRLQHYRPKRFTFEIDVLERNVVSSVATRT